jgi:uncharacterized protein YdeI (YjbR/CyaY-like superfamily)
MIQDLDTVEVNSLADLETWLKKNHKQTESVWLVSFKKNVPEYYIEYSEIVDVLPCYGWIDSRPRKLDENRKMILISPRRPKSVWSKINRDKVKKLIASKRMTAAGFKSIEVAKKNGSWEVLESVDNETIPKDLISAFKKFPKSKPFFENFPPSSKRAILEWIAQAKTETTRQKRLLETAKLAAKNIRANHYRQPKNK